MVCEEFTADIETANGRLKRSSLDKRCDSSVRVPRVYQEEDFGGEGISMRSGRGLKYGLNVVVCVQSRSYISISAVIARSITAVSEIPGHLK